MVPLELCSTLSIGILDRKGSIAEHGGVCEQTWLATSPVPVTVKRKRQVTQELAISANIIR